jgi:hypothetical protein
MTNNRLLSSDKETFERSIAETTLEAIELPPGDKAVLSLQLPAQFIIVFDPVAHAAPFH